MGGRTSATRDMKRQETPTHLLLHERELVEIACEEVHLALLSFAVGVLEHILVLLLRLVQRNLELDDLSR